jgi:micrococcal nuclease
MQIVKPLAVLGAAALLALAASACASTETEVASKSVAHEAATQTAAPEPNPRPGGRSDRIQRVTDGDTVVLNSLGRTRLIGVDTPEVFGGAECYGREASAFTKQSLPPGSRVRYRFDVERRDRYGRALVYLHKGGVFVNAELVRNGYAVPLTIPPNVRHADRFARLSRQARASERGLWASDACAGDADRSANSRATDESESGGSSGSSGSAGSGGSSGLDLSGDKNCSAFSTHAEAQRYFKAKGGPASDPDHLDADHDGAACESLP